MVRGYALLEDRSSPDGLFDVFQARAPNGALVVLRRLRKRSVLEALEEELQRARRLTHPSAAPILDLGRLGDSLYFTLPWFDGAPLRALVDYRAWTVEEAAGVLVPVLGALEDAHSFGLLHQEVAADTIFVTPRGVVLLDFGLAGVARLAGQPFRRACVSPEQAQGKPLTPRSDLFQAGLLLFELLTGRPPALGTVSEVAARIAVGELDTPREAGVKDDAAAAVLERALAFEPGARFASAAEFSRALKQVAPKPADVSARLSKALTASPWPPPSRPVLEPVPEAPRAAVAPASEPRWWRRLLWRG